MSVNPSIELGWTLILNYYTNLKRFFVWKLSVALKLKCNILNEIKRIQVEKKEERERGRELFNTTSEKQRLIFFSENYKLRYQRNVNTTMCFQKLWDMNNKCNKRIKINVVFFCLRKLRRWNMNKHLEDKFMYFSKKKHTQSSSMTPASILRFSSKHWTLVVEKTTHLTANILWMFSAAPFGFPVQCRAPQNPCIFFTEKDTSAAIGDAFSIKCYCMYSYDWKQ